MQYYEIIVINSLDEHLLCQTEQICLAYNVNFFIVTIHCVLNVVMYLFYSQEMHTSLRKSL